MPKVLKQAGLISPVQISAQDLFHHEIIERAGLTPTDLLHVSGEFNPWDAEAALLAANAAAVLWDESASNFTERIKRLIREKISAEIIEFLTGKELSEEVFGLLKQNLDRWLFDQNLTPTHPYLGCSIQLKVPLVGIGAPAKAYLPLVAQALGTTLILPDHYEVANAVGTVVGNVMVSLEGEVFPRMIGAKSSGYYARVANLQELFKHYAEALHYAQEKLKHQARLEAESAGARAVHVGCETHEIIEGIATVSAWAIGKPDLSS
jgi:N-methylhydantoinase A/oxoprolinase/acetone carboxylase beta subunit